MAQGSKEAIIFFFLLFLFGIQLGERSFPGCTRYSSFGYGYRNFFSVEDVFSSPSSDQLFYLEFYVKTSSNAHILIKPEIGGDDGLEIVIGGGSNTFSEIRRLSKTGKKGLSTKNSPDVLSGLEYRQFWVSMDHLGIITVGNKKSDEVIVNWRLDDPFPLRFFAFSSWTNIVADWRFGCKSTSGKIVMEDENLSPTQQLKKDLLATYNPSTLPVEKSQLLEVKVNFKIHHVSLNEKREELSMHGNGVLRWMDPKLRWKPENYGNLTEIFIPPFEIWTPNIRVLNALAIDKLPVFDVTAAGVAVSSDGSIYWRPPFQSLSACAVDLEFWPYDTHNCSVYFGFWMEPPNLVLTVMDEYDILASEKTESEWKIIKVVPYNSQHDDEGNHGILYVEIARGESADSFYWTPYKAAIVFGLCSFWTTSHNLLLGCSSLITLFIALIVVEMAIPAKTVTSPRIVNLYSWTILLSFARILVIVILKKLPQSIRLSNAVSKILNNSFLNFILCLPELPEDGRIYANMNEEENLQSRYQLDALRLTATIERIFFILYIIMLNFVYFYVYF